MQAKESDKIYSDVSSKIARKFSTLQKNINNDINNSFSQIREEFDDHLQAINENTAEITVVEGDVCDIDKRLSKLEEKMDNIHMLLKTLLSQSIFKIELNHDEQRIFLLLYTADEPMSITQMAKKISVLESMVEDSILSMTDKGIPLERLNINSETHFKLDEDFRSIQAKQKPIKIEPEIMRQYQNKLLYSFFNE